MGKKNKQKKRVNYQTLGFKTYQEYMVAKKNGNLEEEIERLKKEKEQYSEKDASNNLRKFSGINNT